MKIYRFQTSLFYRGLVSVGAVGAAAPTDFWNGAFAPTLFIKNSISLLIKLTIEFKNLKSAPTDLEILTRALHDPANRSIYITVVASGISIDGFELFSDFKLHYSSDQEIYNKFLQLYAL